MMGGADDGGAAYDAAIQQLFGDLQDISRSENDRLITLGALQGRAFAIRTFEPHYAQFIQVLRAIVNDPAAKLRTAALAMLVQRDDAYAQSLLLQGLQDPIVALTPAVIALQLLGSNPHALAPALARDLLANSTDPEVRAEAAHLLAADATAIALLAAHMTDKAEHELVRKAAALSLRVLDVGAFVLAARDIAIDKTDNAKLRALTRTALQVLGEDIA